MIVRLGLISAIAAAGALVSSGASAQTSPASGTEVSRSADDDKVICKGEKKTGTRFGKRVCKTARQWELMRIEHQRGAKEMIDKAIIETRRGG